MELGVHRSAGGMIWTRAGQVQDGLEERLTCDWLTDVIWSLQSGVGKQGILDPFLIAPFA